MLLSGWRLQTGSVIAGIFITSLVLSAANMWRSVHLKTLALYFQLQRIFLTHTSGCGWLWIQVHMAWRWCQWCDIRHSCLQWLFLVPSHQGSYLWFSTARASPRRCRKHSRLPSGWQYIWSLNYHDETLRQNAARCALKSVQLQMFQSTVCCWKCLWHSGFKVLHFPERYGTRTCVTITLACFALHNMLRKLYPTLSVGLVDREDNNHNVLPGQWRSEVDLTSLNGALGSGNRDHRAAKRLQDYLKEYYHGVGAVASQWDKI